MPETSARPNGSVCAVEVTQSRSGLRAEPSAFGIHINRFHQLEVDHQAAVAQRRASDVVAATASSNLHVVLTRKVSSVWSISLRGHPSGVSAETVLRTIQLILAPVVMVSACAILVTGLLSHYEAINARMRSMARERLDIVRTSIVEPIVAASTEDVTPRIHADRNASRASPDAL